MKSFPSIVVLGILASAFPAHIVMAETHSVVTDQQSPQTVRIPLTGEIEPYDLWYGIFLDQERVGSLEQKLSLVQIDGERRYVHRIDKQMKIQVEGKKVEVQSIIEMAFSAQRPYRLESARQEFFREDQRKAVILRRSGSEFTVTIEGGETVHALRNIKLDYTLEDLFSTKSWIKNGPIAGEEIRAAELNFEQLRITPVRNSLLRVNKDDSGKVYFDLSINSSARGELGVARLSADGSPESFDFGGNMRLVREDSELAQQTVYSANLREEAQATIDKVLGNADHIQRLVMEIHGEGAKILSQALNDQVEWNEQRAAYVLVRVQEKPHFSGSNPDEMEQNLAETPTYPIRHQVIRTVATRAVAGSQSQTEAAKRLVAFVNQAIGSSDLSISLTVIDVLRSRKGTCKDRARLLTALGRSIGLPTRGHRVGLYGRQFEILCRTYLERGLY